MDNNKLVGFCIKCLTCIVLCLILTIGSCIMHVDYRIGKAIETGVDPIAASLAMHDVIQSKMVLYNLTKTNQPLQQSGKTHF